MTLIDRNVRHSAAAWHAAALTYDGKIMADFVDGKQVQAGVVAFGPMGAGRTLIGVRQNKVSWFKGRVRLVRFSTEALPAARLLTPPAR